jgi:hypothetical protein
MARRLNEQLDYLTLADSPLILDDGQVRVIADDRTAHLPDYSPAGVRAARNSRDRGRSSAGVNISRHEDTCSRYTLPTSMALGAQGSHPYLHDGLVLKLSRHLGDDERLHLLRNP